MHTPTALSPLASGLALAALKTLLCVPAEDSSSEDASLGVTCQGHFLLPLAGYIKNTEKLSYGKERQYKLTVTAYDCGKKRATEDVLVKVSVKPTCSPGWQGECRTSARAPACQ